MQTPEEIAERARKEIRDNLSYIFDRSHAYTNLIMFGGYAGGFAIWNFTRDQLSERCAAIVALLFTVSLTTFILFEVYKMIMNTKEVMATRALILANLAPEEFLNQLNNTRDNHRKFGLRWFMRIWVVAIATAVSTALAAVAILMWNFLALIFSWPLRP